MPIEFMPLPFPMTARQLLDLFGPPSEHWDGTCNLVIDRYDNIYRANNHAECAFSLWRNENPGGTRQRLYATLSQYTQPVLYLIDEYKLTFVITNMVITHSQFYTSGHHPAILDELIAGGMLPEQIRANVKQVSMN